MDATSFFGKHRLVPVVVIDNVHHAVPLAEALLSAGITSMEITLRTTTALAAIEAVAKHVPKMLVGAGSVRNSEHMAAATAAGAQFLVSPGSTQRLIEAAANGSLPWVAGAVTASEVMHLSDAGYRLVKFFPAALAGGASAIKALSQPLPDTQFFPTGGITEASVLDYLALDCVSCVGGSWFVPPSFLDKEDFYGIAALSKTAFEITQALRD